MLHVMLPDGGDEVFPLGRHEGDCGGVFPDTRTIAVRGELMDHRLHTEYRRFWIKG